MWWGAIERHRHALCIVEPRKCHRSRWASWERSSGISWLITCLELKLELFPFSFYRIWCKLPTKKYRNATSSSRHQMRPTTVAIHCNDRWSMWPISVHLCQTFRWRHVNVIFWKNLKRNVCEHHTAPKVFYAILVRRQNLHFQIGRISVAIAFYARYWYGPFRIVG